MARSVSDEVRFRVMRALEAESNLSQRDLSDRLGISLGLVNYCIRGLAEKGFVKIQNFRSAENKLRYAYVLTPQGIAAKTTLARRYLARRTAEYEALKAEIASLRAETQSKQDP